MGLFELIAYGFLVAAFLLFNWVSQRAKRQRLERHLYLVDNGLPGAVCQRHGAGGYPR